jgi:hypothetical protein
VTKSKDPVTVRVLPVPGLLFDPVDTSPEDAAALVASGSFRYAETPAAAPSVTADKEADNGAG